ncbi:hypothetical protein [Streptomyces carpinensis]|uniref:Uncharacterized protein n=1 Tax=Streptomyces carpinensis TaxID=66369 RepID=A0ABV1WBW9_9ACTN|nr:hypothetical protein [Streptomyces carpinensis]
MTRGNRGIRSGDTRVVIAAAVEAVAVGAAGAGRNGDRGVRWLEHHLLIRGSLDAYRPDMDTTASPRVLVVGFDPYRVPGPWDPEPVARAIEAGLAKFAEHGVGVETCLIGLDGRDSKRCG